MGPKLMVTFVTGTFEPAGRLNKYTTINYDNIFIHVHVGPISYFTPQFYLLSSGDKVDSFDIEATRT